MLVHGRGGGRDMPYTPCCVDREFRIVIMGQSGGGESAVALVWCTCVTEPAARSTRNYLYLERASGRASGAVGARVIPLTE